MKKYTLLLFLAFLAACSYLPEQVELDNTILVEETPDYIALSPNNSPAQGAGILFYPGGLVDAHSYIAPFQNLVSQNGRRVVILKVNANLAIFDANKAYRCKDEFDTNSWVIGGHSLGGVVAAMDTDKHRAAYEGVFFLGAYSVSDLSDWNRPALLLSAELDGLTEVDKINENENNLPTRQNVATLTDMPTTSTAGQTIYHEIPGANHAQFGEYGVQKDDGQATISATAQQDQVRSFILAWLEANDL